jgi:pantetheine-phosphate adenylyltransferase
MNPSNRIAVCPGTYDPITFGHVDVITRASQMFDEVIVAVVNVPIRKGKTLFSTEERVELAQEAVGGLANVRVASFANLIVDFARENGAKAIVKGLRAISDFEYEFEMNQLNRKLAPDVESVYLMASPQYSFLSSSGIKEMATFGGDIEDLVPARVAQRLKEELQRQRK